MIRALEISGSALSAQRTRMDVIAGNMANAFTTVQEDGRNEPYRRRTVSFAAGDGSGNAGVHVFEVAEDPSQFRLQYDPGNPQALRTGPYAGYVRYPNVNLSMEYVDAMEAARAYEANLALMNVSRDMTKQAVQLLA